jgi:hypothetical protein
MGRMLLRSPTAQPFMHGLLDHRPVLPGSLALLGSSSSPKSAETYPCTSITLRDFRSFASARSARRSRAAIASRLLPA